MAEPTPDNLPALIEPWATALREALAWILAELPARAVLVSGTPVRGNPDPASDLDIQVINRESWSQRITRFFAGVPCEIFVNPVHRLDHWYRNEVKTGCHSTAHMVATGVAVHDPEGLCPAVRAEARTWVGRPPEPDPVQAQRARYAPATDIEDARDVLDRDPELAALCAAEALPAMLDAFFLDRRLPRPRRKDRLSALAALDPDAAVLLRRALGASEPRARVAAADDLCQRLLGVRGTFAWESPREPVPEPLPETGTFRRDLGGGLVLREVREEDCAPTFAIVDAERERLERFMGFVAPTRSIEDLRSMFRGWQSEIRIGYRRVMSILVDDRLVGRISLKSIDRTLGTSEIGYWVAGAAEGRGIMTRTLHAVCDHAFKDLNLQRLSLFTHPDNERSQRLARRCGFQQEGIFHRAWLLNGQRVDQVWFARLKDDPLP